MQTLYLWPDPSGCRLYLWPDPSGCRLLWPDPSGYRLSTCDLIQADADSLLVTWSKWMQTVYLWGDPSGRRPVSWSHAVTVIPPLCWLLSMWGAGGSQKAQAWNHCCAGLVTGSVSGCLWWGTEYAEMFGHSRGFLFCYGYFKAWNGSRSFAGFVFCQKLCLSFDLHSSFNAFSFTPSCGFLPHSNVNTEEGPTPPPYVPRQVSKEVAHTHMCL